LTGDRYPLTDLGVARDYSHLLRCLFYRGIGPKGIFIIRLVELTHGLQAVSN
jgi:hypothetical protein